MKRFLTVLIVSFTATISLAQKPMMATSVLRGIQQTQGSPYEVYRCNKYQELNSPSSEIDSFDTQISCQIKCRDGKSTFTTLTKRFTPQSFGLGPGDGTTKEKIFWRTLGYTLSTWGDQTCLEEAKNKCNDFEGIKDFNLVSMTSGNWSFDGKLNCSQKEIVYSPFDKSIKLSGFRKTILKENHFGEPQVTQEKNSFQTLLPKNMTKEEAQNLFSFEDEKKACDHSIHIKSCFGDCVLVKEGETEWTETLATNEFYGDYDFSICADKFFSKIKNNKWSDDVNNSQCKKLAWEAIRLSEMLGTSCAAYRVEVDCSQL